MNDSNEKMTFVVSTTYASRHLPRMSTNASDHVTAVVRQKTSTAENTNSTHRRTARGKRRGACLAGDRSSNSVKKRRGNTNCTAKQKKCSSLAQDTGRRNISRGSNDIILESRKDAFRPGNTFFRLLCWKARPAYFNAKKNRQEQERIIQGIAKQIKKLDPPGRFLLVDYYKSGKPCYKMAEVDVVAFKIYQTIKNQRTAPSTVLCNASNGEDLMNSRLSNHATLEDNCFMDSSSESERDQDGKNASLFPSSSKNSVGEGKEQKTVTGKSLRLRENDVVLLVGRGTSGGTQDHPGNIELRRLCWEAKGAYHSADKTQKTAIAAEIVAKVKGQKPRGRFLKLVEGDKKNLFDRKNIFVEAEKERVSLKISGFMSSMRPFEEDEDDEPDLATGVSFRLRETDVVLLVGRGNGGTKVHSGNNMLRRLCWEAKDAYRIADKTQRSVISAEIVARVKNQTPRGRFLKLVEGDTKNLFDCKNVFVEAERERILLKIQGYMSSFFQKK